MNCRFRKISITAVFACTLLLGGCVKPKIHIFPDKSEPLREVTLQGKGRDRILVIPVEGFISDSARRIPFRSRPNLVKEIVSQLEKAKKDQRVKGVVLKVNSPGGSTFASDALYEEIKAFREESQAALVVAMMGTAASGGYYISLPAHYIMAHPTTLTGSVGVIFMRPQWSDLMEKLGVHVSVEKSGENKDMGSPFRDASPEEMEILRTLTHSLGDRFLKLVTLHRSLDEAALREVATSRIFLAEEALSLGLIDGIGYLDDALEKTRLLAGLGPEPRIVVYRRQKEANDNIYNTMANAPSGGRITLTDIHFLESLPVLQSGFYYLWLPEGGVP